MHACMLESTCTDKWENKENRDYIETLNEGEASLKQSVLLSLRSMHLIQNTSFTKFSISA